MNKYILFILIALCNCSLFSQKSNTAFKIDPEHPKPGSKAAIQYDATATVLENKENVEAVMYTYANYNWLVEDVDMEQVSKNKWEAKIDLNKNAAFLSFKFTADTLVDKGGKFPYSWIIGESPGSYWAWGLARNKMLKEETPDFVNQEAFISDTLTLFWLNNELKHHPKSREYIMYPALKLMSEVRPGSPIPRIKSEINVLLNTNLDLQQQYELEKILSLLPSETENQFKDSVRQAIVKKYPRGVYARDQQILKLFKESDFQKKSSGFNDFQQIFPKEKFADIYSDTESLYYEKLYKSIAYGHLMNQKDYQFIFDNLETAPYNIVLDYNWHLVSIPNNRETATADSLYNLAHKFIPVLESWEYKIPKAYQGKLSPKEWKQKALEMNANEYLTYAQLLEKTNRFEEQEKYLEKLSSIYHHSNAEYNQIYTNFLERSKGLDAAVDYIKKSLKENAVTAAMLTTLKADFLKNGAKDDDFQSYLSSLKSKELIENQQSKLLEELIKKPIDNFNLKNLKGETVSLQDQKGKIVIIDMWATWCAPCKKAMPGMQLAVNRYANDENVIFYFLDTQEYAKDYKKKVKEFIEEENYPFNVLFDGQNPKTGKMDEIYAKYSKAFQFSGIPQKLIIDQNGYLRWRSTGYAGKPNQLADELSFIINYLKNE